MSQELSSDAAASPARNRVQLTEHQQELDADTPTAQTSPVLSDCEEQGSFCQTSTLSFPRLESDGSLPDLKQELASTRRYQTPPAALSSLGARGKMAQHEYLIKSTDSLDDGQYDMLDDVSVDSSEDRETASLHTDDTMSEDEDGMTPDEEGRAANIDFDFGTGSTGYLARTLHVSGDQDSGEANRLIDSLSEELETPRQSIIHQQQPSSYTRNSVTRATLPMPNKHRKPVSLNIWVHVSDDEAPSTIRDIGTRIAKSIGNGQQETCDITELPATPDGASGTLIIRYENLELNIDHLDDSALESHVQLVTGNDWPHPQPDLIVFGSPQKSNILPELLSLTCTIARRHRVGVITICDEAYVRDVLAPLDYPSLNMDEEVFFGDKVGAHRGLLRGQVSKKLSAAKWKPVAKADEEKWHWPSFSSCTFTHSWPDRKWTVLLLLLLAQVYLSVIFQATSWRSIDPMEELAQRRSAASSALIDLTNSTDAPNVFKIEHLLPANITYYPQIHSTIVAPKYVAVSVVTVSTKDLAGGTTFHAHARGHEIDFNTTKILDGLYLLTIPVDEAYGLVEYDIAFGKPSMRGSLSHDYGSRLWQPNVYSKARTDLAKVINKDVAVARKAAKSFADRMGLELYAGAAATKNVTTQVAIRMTRDVHLFFDTAAAAFGNAASQSGKAASRMSRDLSVVRKDIAKRVDDAKKAVATTAHSIRDLIVPKKTTFSSPLARSRQRALGFKDVMIRKNKDVDHKSYIVPEKPTSSLGKYFGKGRVAQALDARKAKAAEAEKKMKGKSHQSFDPAILKLVEEANACVDWPGSGGLHRRCPSPPGTENEREKKCKAA